MVQNHLLQVVGLVAMEPPSIIESNAIRNETLKIFQSLRKIKPQDVPRHVVRGQYAKAVLKKEEAKGYREEAGVAPDSRTETFVAMKFYIDNWRWAGVPFYLRAGKRLPTRVTEVVIHYNPTPLPLFKTNDVGCQSCDLTCTSCASCGTRNQLVIRIQPDEGILLNFNMKEPGRGFRSKKVGMVFHYKDLAEVYLPTAYERLLLDCMIGDSTLFSRADAVETCWEFVTPIFDAWEKNPDIPMYPYPAGNWGPDAANQIFEGKGMGWRYPCKNLAGEGLYCEL
jgi:glucose-6-phosphate 1-dehydrogenase